MKKRMVLLVILVGILLWSNPAYAKNVTVQVPTFKVELDGVAYDDQHAKYPLLVYQDVTYFPMTYQLTRSLGLVTGWDNKKGLYIAQHEEECREEADMSGNNKLGGKYTATVPTYPIIVNGWSVDNSKESYPLLNFRGVTYFPLSWHYAYEEFGWEIQWDAKTGLQVNVHDNRGCIALIQLNQNSALFQQYITDFGETKNEEGDTVYTRIGDRYQNYRLDFAAEKLYEAGTKEEETTWETYDGEDVSEAFALNGTQLLYQGEVILSGIPEAYTEKTSILADRFSGENSHLLAVKLHYNTAIPAPYTPYVWYVFLETKDGVQQIRQWNEADFLSGFYETENAYYLCSSARHVTSRFSNSLHTILKMDKNSGQETILNDLYSQYRSLEAIGVDDDKLYVRAIYFGEEDDLQNPMFSSKVNPIQDGYFYIDSENKLHKVHDYVDGEPFLASNGKLYVYSADRLRVTNLTDHKQIPLASAD